MKKLMISVMSLMSLLTCSLQASSITDEDKSYWSERTLKVVLFEENVTLQIAAFKTFNDGKRCDFTPDEVFIIDPSKHLRPKLIPGPGNTLLLERTAVELDSRGQIQGSWQTTEGDDCHVINPSTGERKNFVPHVSPYENLFDKEFTPVIRGERHDGFKLGAAYMPYHFFITDAHESQTWGIYFSIFATVEGKEPDYMELPYYQFIQGDITVRSKGNKTKVNIESNPR